MYVITVILLCHGCTRSIQLNYTTETLGQNYLQKSVPQYFELLTDTV
jgi:hypothetical protein